jgi:L-rhamnonate dehydratase
MNTPWGQHFSFATANVEWGEFFVGGGPGVPLGEASAFPGMPVPVKGRIVPSDAPGFGIELTLQQIDDLKA